MRRAVEFLHGKAHRRIRTGLETALEHAAWPHPVEHHRTHALVQARPQAAARQPPGERVEDLPVVHRAGRLREEWRRVLRRVPDGQHVEHQIVVFPLSGTGGREDDVRVPSGLIYIEVDRHEELEARDRAVEPRAVGRGEYRVSRVRHECAHLSLARRFDLIGERCHRQLTREFRETANAALPARESSAPAVRAASLEEIDGGAREHRAAGLVEMAGDRVQHVDEPAREPAELLRGDAHAPVRHGPRSAGEVPGQCADCPSRNAGGRCDTLGGETGGELPHVHDSIRETGETLQLLEAIGEDHVQEPQQQQRVGARTDEVVFACDIRGLGAPRIDDHHATAAGADLPDAPLDVRRGHQAAVGHRGIRAEYEKEIRALEIRDRDEQGMPEHPE